MKKMILLLAGMLIFTANAAFATDFLSAAGVKLQGLRTGGTQQDMGQLSNNVILAVKYTTSEYAAGSKHKNGTKFFGSSNGDTKIFSKDSAVGTDIALTDISATNSAAFSSWVSM